MREQSCQSCVHFIDDPGAIEAEFPTLTVFGSAYSSARGHAGICVETDRFMDPLPAYCCPSFAPQGESSGQRDQQQKSLTNSQPTAC